MNKIAKYLNKYLTGAAYDAPQIIAAYSTDNSVLKIAPKTVVVPKTTKDIRRIARFSDQLAAKKLKFPLTPRGTGLDKTGASIGQGIIVSLEEMNHIQEIDTRQRLVRVQAGVRLGELNTALALHGLKFPFEDQGKDQTIGGLIAGCGTQRLYPYIIQAEIVLSNGDLIQTERINRRTLEKHKGQIGFEGEIYRDIDRLISENHNAFEAPVGLSGYPGLAAVEDNNSFDLLPLFFASQGTLGIISEVILSCDIYADAPTCLIISHKTANAALDFIESIGEFAPSDIQIFDTNLFRETANAGKNLRMLKKLPENGILTYVQFNDRSRGKRNRKLKRIVKLLPESANYTISDEDNKDEFAEIDSIISVFINGLPRDTRPPIVDDAYVPTDKLKEYFVGIAKLEEKYGLKLPVYGSLTHHNYSVRPEINLGTVTGRQFIMTFLRDYGDTVGAAGGSLAGGTAEGRLKAIYTNFRLESATAEVYREVKRIFDPRGILNPGVKQETTLESVVRQLRTTYNLGLNRP